MYFEAKANSLKMSTLELLGRMAVEAACLGAVEQFNALTSLARPPFTPTRARFAAEAIAHRLSCPEPLLSLQELVEHYAELTANTVLFCYSATGWDLIAWDASQAKLLRAHSSEEFSADHPLIRLPHAFCNYGRLELQIKAKMMMQSTGSPAVVTWRDGGKIKTRKVSELPRDMEKGGELAIREEYERAREQLEAYGASTKGGRYHLVHMPLGGRPAARAVRAATMRGELERASGPRRLAAIYDSELKRLTILRF